MRFFPVMAVLSACSPGAVQLQGSLAVDDVDAPVFPLDASSVPMRARLAPVQACDRAVGATPRHDRRTRAQPASSLRYLWANGMLVGDLDGDGLHDLVAPSEPYAQLYTGVADGGAQPSAALASLELEFGAGGSLADYDGDGDLDVFLARFDRPDVLLRNDGIGVLGQGVRFSNVSAVAGVDARGPSTTSAWADMDRDGDLDLFVARYGDLLGGGEPAASMLYENRGDGTFADRSEHLPVSVQRAWTRMAGWHDLDLDGYPELIVINDLGDPSVLLWNVAGRLVEDDGRSGLQGAVRGAGLGVGDVNGDGTPDLLVTEWQRMSLLESTDADMWVEHAAARRLVPDAARGQAVPWGAELADVDNDGLLDAVVSFGNLQVEGADWANPLAQPDGIYLQQPDGTFMDAASEWGMDDAGIGRGFVVADINRDGSLDLVKRDLNGPGVLYLSECSAAHWLRVELEQPGTANRHAVGATVRVWADGHMMQRTVTAGSTGIGSGGPPELHFGLGDRERVERLEVIWPDGTRSEQGGFDASRAVTLIKGD